MTKRSSRADHRPYVLDLFAGVGGFSLGAARAGFEVVAAAEIDARCVAAHAQNFPETAHLEADISQLSAADIFRATGLMPGEVEGIIGGPPCQGFSSIGKNAVDDTRNQLVAHFFRLVEEISPKFFVMENVPGIVSSRHEAFLRPMLRKIGRRYRLVGPLLLKASEFGAPTSRTRAFIFGFDDSRFSTSICETHLTRSRHRTVITVEDALSGLPRRLHDRLYRKSAPGEIKVGKIPSALERHLRGHIPPGVGHRPSIEKLQQESRVTAMFPTSHSEEVRTRYANLGPGEMDRVTKSTKLVAKGFCPTLRAGTGPERGSFQAVRPIHHAEPRVITPREGARLQGFPDWFQFHDTIWHSFRMIGNSVCPILAEAVLSPIAEVLCKEITREASSSEATALAV